MRYRWLRQAVDVMEWDGDNYTERGTKYLSKDPFKHRGYKNKYNLTAENTAESKDNGKKDKHVAAPASESSSSTSSSTSSWSSSSAQPADMPCTCRKVHNDGINRKMINNLTEQYPYQKFVIPDCHFSVVECEALSALEVIIILPGKK